MCRRLSLSNKLKGIIINHHRSDLVLLLFSIYHTDSIFHPRNPDFSWFKLLMSSDKPVCLTHTLKSSVLVNWTHIYSVLSWVWSHWNILYHIRWIFNKALCIMSHSYGNTAQFTFKCARVGVCLLVMCPDVGVHAKKPLKLLILSLLLPHVSAFFEHHVALIIKGALVPLQTYAMNMDRIWRPKFHLHPAHVHVHVVIMLQFRLIDTGANVQNMTSQWKRVEELVSCSDLWACFSLNRCLTIHLNLACGWDVKTIKSEAHTKR